MSVRRAFIAVALLCCAPLSVARAVAASPQTSRQQPASAPANSASARIDAAALDGPPPPVAPAVITRDEKGGATLRAVRIDRPLKIDGQLDEEVYGNVAPAGGFIMQDPSEGAEATEQTDTWVFFDSTNLYIAARCWDDHPERWVTTELRRDNNNIIQNENLSVALDTFHDHRNGFFFQTTPLGALRDQAFTDEGNPNSNWNTIWQVKSGRFDGGWTVEMVIPFKSLRYRGSGPQTWGINFRRIVKWKNEVSFLTRVPRAYGRDGIFRPSVAGTLVELETPAQSMNLELKPYAVSSLTTDHAAVAPFDNRFSRNAGFDFKYGLTRSLIADATVNTDFAQVEEDVQQINLTRFSLQFPEKRDFFLEGQGIFNFGGNRGGGNSTNDIPILFFSRRIGLSQGQSVPVIAGGRLAGTVGKFGVGALNIQTDDKPSAGAAATNFSVVRVKRDILRRSNIGLLATHRTPSANQQSANDAFGADANLAFFRAFRSTVITRARRRRAPAEINRAIAGGSITPAIAMGYSSNTCWSVTTSTPTSGSCAAATSAAVPSARASARDRSPTDLFADSTGKPVTTTSRTADARGSRTVNCLVRSRSTSTTATNGVSTTRATSNFCRVTSRSHAA
jgi:hypothetical protein